MAGPAPGWVPNCHPFPFCWCRCSSALYWWPQLLTTEEYAWEYACALIGSHFLMTGLIWLQAVVMQGNDVDGCAPRQIDCIYIGSA